MVLMMSMLKTIICAPDTYLCYTLSFEWSMLHYTISSCRVISIHYILNATANAKVKATGSTLIETMNQSIQVFQSPLLNSTTRHSTHSLYTYNDTSNEQYRNRKSPTERESLGNGVKLQRQLSTISFVLFAFYYRGESMVLGLMHPRYHDTMLMLMWAK